MKILGTYVKVLEAAGHQEHVTRRREAEIETQKHQEGQMSGVLSSKVHPAKR